MSMDTLWGSYPTNYTEIYTVGIYDGEGPSLDPTRSGEGVWFMMQMERKEVTHPWQNITWFGQLVCYDPLTFDTLRTVRLPNSPSDYSGLAIVPHSDPELSTFWFSQPDSQRIYHTDSDGSPVSAFDIGQTGITGLAFDPDNGHLWAIASGEPDVLLEYSVAGGTPELIQGPFPVPWDSSNAAAGLEYDEENDELVAINKNNGDVVRFIDVAPDYAGPPGGSEPGVLMWKPCGAVFTPFPSGIALLAPDSAEFVAGNPAGGPLPLDLYGATVACDCTPGDANGSGVVNIADAVYMINAIFGDGPFPVPYETCSGDADGSCVFNISDIVYIINRIFGGGLPMPTCEQWLYGWPEHVTCHGCGWPIR
jgi:hypothetical protein